MRLEFLPGSPTGSVVRFAHGGWTSENAAHRHKSGDWGILLDPYAALAAS